MIALYLIIGAFLFVTGIFFAVALKIGQKKPVLPPQIAANIEYMWKNHPNLLINQEMILRQWNDFIQEKMDEDKAREERIESNKEFERKNLSGITVPNQINITLEGFAIKNLLVRHYLGERSLLMEALLLKICNKITRYLDTEELDFICQIDRKWCADLLDNVLEQDSDIKDGMIEIDRILKKNNPPEENPNNSIPLG